MTIKSKPALSALEITSAVVQSHHCDSVHVKIAAPPTRTVFANFTRTMAAAVLLPGNTRYRWPGRRWDSFACCRHHSATYLLCFNSDFERNINAIRRHSVKTKNDAPLPAGIYPADKRCRLVAE